MADVAKMPASVPTGPTGALAGDDGVDRPGDEIRDAGAEGKRHARWRRGANRNGRDRGWRRRRRAGGRGKRERGRRRRPSDERRARRRGDRGGARPPRTPPPASGDADRPDSEERDDEDDENDEDADDPSLATSDHDDETPLIPRGGIPRVAPMAPGAPPIDALGGEHHAGGAERVFPPPSEAACRRLGIGRTVLKRQCRKFGIKRWPFAR